MPHAWELACLDHIGAFTDMVHRTAEQFLVVENQKGKIGNRSAKFSKLNLLGNWGP